MLCRFVWITLRSCSWLHAMGCTLEGVPPAYDKPKTPPPPAHNVTSATWLAPTRVSFLPHTNSVGW